jgi:hypothetical protein
MVRPPKKEPSYEGRKKRTVHIKTLSGVNLALSAHRRADAGVGNGGSPYAISCAERRIVARYKGCAGRATKMQEEEWIKTLEDGRRVKFIYQELPVDGAFLTAQLQGNEVVYSVVLTKAGNPLSHENVESHFRDELAKR